LLDRLVEAVVPDDPLPAPNVLPHAPQDFAYAPIAAIELAAEAVSLARHKIISPRVTL
jgi:hypothetical protein